MTVLLQTIQFIKSIQFSSIQPIDRALFGATIPGQSDLGAMQGDLCITQIPSINGTSPSDCLVSYPGHSLWDVFGVVGVLNSPSWLGQRLDEFKIRRIETILDHSIGKID